MNLSPRTIEASEFSAPAMLNILARYDFPPERLVIELTEHQPIVDLERVRRKLDTCRAAGIRVAADDLGAGNSGLKLLSDLHFDVVKVDLGLIQRSSNSAASSAVVESIVAFAVRTGALVIGEGVEHEEQVEQLTALGVTAAQGYLFSRPGPLPEFASEKKLKRAADRQARPLPPRRPRIPTSTPGAARSGSPTPPSSARAQPAASPPRPPRRMLRPGRPRRPATRSADRVGTRSAAAWRTAGYGAR